MLGFLKGKGVKRSIGLGRRWEQRESCLQWLKKAGIHGQNYSETKENKPRNPLFPYGWGGGEDEEESRWGLRAVQQNTLQSVCTLLLSATLKHTLTSACVQRVLLGAAGSLHCWPMALMEMVLGPADEVVTEQCLPEALRKKLGFSKQNRLPNFVSGKFCLQSRSGYKVAK